MNAPSFHIRYIFFSLYGTFQVLVTLGMRLIDTDSLDVGPYSWHFTLLILLIYLYTVILIEILIYVIQLYEFVLWLHVNFTYLMCSMSVHYIMQKH
jgi:hypothetical protein